MSKKIKFLALAAAEACEYQIADTYISCLNEVTRQYLTGGSTKGDLLSAVKDATEAVGRYHWSINPEKYLGIKGNLAAHNAAKAAIIAAETAMIRSLQLRKIRKNATLVGQLAYECL